MTVMPSRIFWAVWRFVTHPWTRYIAAWLALIPAALWLHRFAQITFDNHRKGDTAVYRPGLDYQDERELPGREWVIERLFYRGFDNRYYGSDGYTSVDFAGQWLMGRMVVRGYGRELYDRNRQFEVALAGFPRELEAPHQPGHDAENLVWMWLMDCDSLDARHRYAFDCAARTKASLVAPLMADNPLEAAVLLSACHDEVWTEEKLAYARQKRVGGPLYPPIHAFLFAPLALDDQPQRAYFRMQWVMLAMGFVAGLGLRFLTQGRIWWPVATALILFFPGFEGGHHLGQNGPLSLAILIWGWVLVMARREALGGAVWGLLAFKPVWAAAFFLVPLLTRRWRMCLTMAATGIALVLATLPFVGLHSWQEWLKIGSVASWTYDLDPNWIPLSRDLLGIPRRLFEDFEESYYDRDRWYLQVAGWGLWAIVVETTVRLTLLCRRENRATTGPAAAFILLGAWLSCFHFMYYDAVLAALGVLVLLAEPAKLVEPVLVVFNPPYRFRLTQAVRDYFRPRLAETHPELAQIETKEGAIVPQEAVAELSAPARLPTIWVANSFILYALVVLLVIQNLFTFWGISATFQMRLYPPYTVSRDGIEVIGSDGLPVKKTQQLEVTTHQNGPAWDTYSLLGVWLWAGVQMVRSKLRAQSAGADAEPAASKRAKSNRIDTS
jgi:hypothetical protein